MHQEPVTKTEEAGRTHFRTGEDTGRMTVPEMTEYLTEMKLQEESLRKRRQEVECEIVTVDEYIRLNAYGSHSGEGMGRSGFRDSDTLYRIWENIEREYEERLAVLSEEALRIAKEEQKLGYVRSCMRFLPAGQEEILRMLYVEGMMQKEYTLSHGISRSTVLRNASRAMNNLVYIYNTYVMQQHSKWKNGVLDDEG